MRLIIFHWGLLVSTLTVAGTICGWGAGMALTALSGDYAVVPSDHVSLGLRAGLFAGAVAAAWHGMTQQAPLRLREMLRALIVIILGAVGVTCLLLLLAGLLSTLHTGLLNEATLAHPRRHVIFVVMHHVWLLAWVSGVFLGGWWIWRKRASKSADQAADAEQA